MIQRNDKFLLVEHLVNLSEQSELKEFIKPLFLFCLNRLRQNEDLEELELIPVFLSRILIELKLSVSSVEVLIE